MPNLTVTVQLDVRAGLKQVSTKRQQREALIDQVAGDLRQTPGGAGRTGAAALA